MLVLLLSWWQSCSCFVPYGSISKTQTTVFCSNFRVLFLLTAQDYSHRKLWIPGWHRKQWKELSADTILMSSLASLLPKCAHMSKTNSSSPQKSYLHCCTKPERLQGTHFTGFWYEEFWNSIKKIWSQKREKCQLHRFVKACWLLKHNEASIPSCKEWTIPAKHGLCWQEGGCVCLLNHLAGSACRLFFTVLINNIL